VKNEGVTSSPAVCCARVERYRPARRAKHRLVLDRRHGARPIEERASVRRQAEIGVNRRELIGEQNDALPVWQRYRPKQHGIDDREDRRVRA
jgi:hypothetical protein